MKSIILKFTLTCLFIIAYTADAQGIVSGSQQIDFSSGFTTMPESPELDNVKGSPYFDEDPIEGILVINGKDKYSTFLKYNIYKDRVEMAKSKDFMEIKSLPIDQDIMILMDDDKFKYLNINTNNRNIKGYFKILSMQADEPVLVARMEQELKKPSAIQNNSYSSSNQLRNELITRTTYYLVENGKAVEIVKHKRKSLNSFPSSERDSLEDFIKSNKLKFKDEEDLKLLVEEYYKMK